ncbi:hypothetical protein BRCH_00766c [Candidatus Burkholderia brachyanthoides]|nr:hypothetical protein BRCH_00766c [Candidatus Burkholderia brachyanthoides]
MLAMFMAISYSNAVAAAGTGAPDGIHSGTVITLGIVEGGLRSYIDDTGDGPGGLGVDYLAHALKAANLALNIKRFNSQDALNNFACRGEVDLLVDGSHTASREGCFIYSNPYYRSATVSVTRKDHPQTFA